MIHRLVTSRGIRSFANCSGTVRAAVGASTRPTSQIIGSNIFNNQQQQTRNYLLPSSRHFSSHDDFSPQKKHNLEEGDDNASAVLDLIDSHVKANRIMLYMKGSPNQPMCGFSATVVQILKNSGADFASVNVLDYPEVREGVKKYAQWPTIPQLYVDGEFVGGCDIVKDMNDSGELMELLKAPEGGEKKEWEDWLVDIMNGFF